MRTSTKSVPNLAIQLYAQNLARKEEIACNAAAAPLQNVVVPLPRQAMQACLPAEMTVADRSRAQPRLLKAGLELKPSSQKIVWPSGNEAEPKKRAELSTEPASSRRRAV